MAEIRDETEYELLWNQYGNANHRLIGSTKSRPTANPIIFPIVFNAPRRHNNLERLYFIYIKGDKRKKIVSFFETIRETKEYAKAHKLKLGVDSFMDGSILIDLDERSN